jgi:ethanolamine permease
VASFHGVIISYSRQLYAVARDGYLPKVLAKVNTKHRTPHVAMIAGGVVGIIALCIFNTGDVIILSALGAVVMYIISLISLLVLRRKLPAMERPFKVPLYPWFPLTALVLALVCLVSIIWYNLWLSLIFFVALGLLMALFMIFRKKDLQTH